MRKLTTARIFWTLRQLLSCGLGSPFPSPGGGVVGGGVVGGGVVADGVVGGGVLADGVVIWSP